MDFGLSPEQRQFRDQIGRFAREELRPLLQAGGGGDAGELETAWKRCGEIGLFGLVAPEELGGSARDALSCALAFEALGHGCQTNGFPFAVGVQVLAGVVPMMSFGSQEQKRALLEGMIAGRLRTAFCATEPESGSDVLSLRTVAEAPGDGLVLDGTKSFVSNAPAADLFLVLAQDREVESTVPMRRLSVFLVERDRDGLQVGRAAGKLGLRASPMADLYLQGCRVPAANRLGPPGAGYAVFSTVMQWERVMLPAIAVGIMQAQLESTCAYARRRRQFERPISEFQAVGHGLAEMKARLDASRLLVYRAAWLMSQGRQAVLEASVAKLVASESFKKSSLQAIQLHGGAGYMEELGLAEQLRDAVAATLYSGTSEIQKNIIARLLR